MMFAVRCLGVSLAFFLIIYCALSIAVLRSWRFVQRLGRNFSARTMANLLFSLRVLPTAAAIVMCCAFVIPSFLLLEPRVSSEAVGEIPLTLGLGCAALFVAGAYNAWAAYMRTSRAVENWLMGATELTPYNAVPVFQIRHTVPALTLTGVCAPRVLLSSSAAALLATTELNAALKHEIAHVRRRDNLKKLIFRLCVFPGMAQLEMAWSVAEEMAADDEAVSSTDEALDLASALIKLSRLAPVQPKVALTTALLQGGATAVNARIQRLVAWDDSRVTSTRGLGRYLKPTLLGTGLGILFCYGSLLHDMHSLTELLVR